MQQTNMASQWFLQENGTSSTNLKVSCFVGFILSIFTTISLDIFIITAEVHVFCIFVSVAVKDFRVG